MSESNLTPERAGKFVRDPMSASALGTAIWISGALPPREQYHDKLLEFTGSYAKNTKLVADNLRALMGAQAMNPGYLAKMAGMTPHYVVQILNDEANQPFGYEVMWLAILLTAYTKFDYNCVFDKTLVDHLISKGID